MIMEAKLEFVYLIAITTLTIGLLLWFILGFVPSMIEDLKKKD